MSYFLTVISNSGDVVFVLTASCFDHQDLRRIVAKVLIMVGPGSGLEIIIAQY